MNNKGLWIFTGVLALVVVSAGLYYNRLVGLREGVPASWAQVENVLQRRFDLIPNLVSTVKGYAAHEKKLLTEIVRLRSQWGSAKTAEDRVKAGSALEGALSRLLVVVEQYPNLKANENFLRLQDELAGTENRIAVERMRYNDAVRSYSVALKGFPGALYAKWFGFVPVGEYFQAEKEAAKAPKVDFKGE
jgi:LemA protein